MLNLKDSINKKIIVYREEEEDTDIRYTSAVQEVNENHIAIAIPFRKRLPLTLKENDMVKIKLVGQGELFILTHTYLGLRKDNIPLYLLSLPENIIRIQQRDYVRLPIILNVNYKAKDSDKFVAGKSLDLSGGGLKLIVASLIEEGTILDLEFSLPCDSRRIEVEAKVVRSEMIEVKEGKLNCVGLKFIDISESLQENIISFIFNKMAEQRRMNR